jgi:hypothetical protein
VLLKIVPKDVVNAHHISLVVNAKAPSLIRFRNVYSCVLRVDSREKLTQVRWDFQVVDSQSALPWVRV